MSRIQMIKRMNPVIIGLFPVFISAQFGVSFGFIGVALVLLIASKIKLDVKIYISKKHYMMRFFGTQVCLALALTYLYFEPDYSTGVYFLFLIGYTFTMANYIDRVKYEQ